MTSTYTATTGYISRTAGTSTPGAKHGQNLLHNAHAFTHHSSSASILAAAACEGHSMVRLYSTMRMPSRSTAAVQASWLLLCVRGSHTLKALPMISSACPLAYTSALSKKLTPTSRAADSSALACRSHGPGECLSCGPPGVLQVHVVATHLAIGWLVGLSGD